MYSSGAADGAEDSTERYTTAMLGLRSVEAAFCPMWSGIRTNPCDSHPPPVKGSLLACHGSSGNTWLAEDLIIRLELVLITLALTRTDLVVPVADELVEAPSGIIGWVKSD